MKINIFKLNYYTTLFICHLLMLLSLFTLKVLNTFQWKHKYVIFNSGQPLFCYFNWIDHFYLLLHSSPSKVCLLFFQQKSELWCECIIEYCLYHLFSILELQVTYDEGRSVLYIKDLQGVMLASQTAFVSHVEVYRYKQVQITTCL